MFVKNSDMKRCVSALLAGEAIIFPTDTVYGLGVAIEFVQSLDILYALKGRKSDKPIAWLVESPEALYDYGVSVPEYAHILANRFWPGALTLVLKASKKVPPGFQSATNTIALRMPHHQVALELLRATGCPLATTSANLSGQDCPQTFEGINPTLKQKVAFALRDDEEISGLSSSVVDCTGERPILLREGSISLVEIQEILGQ
jgi:L-threonylcarbamoyladenylate synthase